MSELKKRKVTSFWGISIIIMESLVVFFIFYILYFFWIENPTPTDNILIVRAVTKKGLVIPKSVNTVNWFKYNNKNIGFTFQYPAKYIVSEDEIAYGNNEGKVLDLSENDTIPISLRFFGILEGETIPEAYERLTSINPDVYQMYTEKVGDKDAIIYRKKSGEASGDQIYFIGNNRFFEMGFDEVTSKILATFQFNK